MKRICFATNNNHKLNEVKAILSSEYSIVGLAEIGCDEELPETQNTLEGNSLQKAKYVFENYGVSCFADDTGLEVEALNGEPGVFSARYAGPQRSNDDNVNLLLHNLANKENRKAQFRTVITLITAENTYQFEGVVIGQIIEERRGNGGFGYDPVFVPNGYDSTFAEMIPSKKNNISHRGRAMHKLVEFLKSREILT